MVGRFPPDALDPLGADDGLYVVEKTGARFRAWRKLVAGAGVSLDTATPGELEIGATGAGTNEFRLEDYGAVGDETTDDSAAWLLMKTAVETAGGGTLILEPKTYLFNGALQTSHGGYAVLPLPEDVPFRIVGVTPANNCDPRTDTGYSIIKTTKTGLAHSGTFGTPSLLGGPTDGTWSETMVSIENVCFWLPHNPTIAGVDLRYVRRMLWDGCTVVAINVGDADFVQPTSVYAFGLRTPEAQNYNAVLVRNGAASGMYAGIVGSVESLTLAYWSSKWCVVGWAPMTGGHGGQVDKISLEWCTYMISGWSETAGVTSLVSSPTGETHALISVAELAIEDAAAAHWYSTTEHIHDPTNRLYGVVQYDHYVIGTGPVSTLTISGTANLLTSPLLAPAFGGVPTSRAINTDATLTGGGNLSADRTLGVETTAEAERIRDVIGAALVQGSNITITINDAGDTITITGTASELLMQDGVTGPPVPLENEARDDWLYQG